ncbi:MAG: BlaI/MecI/CopY family transcriptional regulator [Armatimonadota bacterium]|jgi:predicted transcriptional regulator
MSDTERSTGRGGEPDLSVFKLDKHGIEQALGRLEAQVMEAVWDAGESVSVEDVRARLEEQGKDAAYTTIMTTMSRLYEKDLLEREQRGRAYYYWPSLSRSELSDNVTRRVIDGLLSSFAEPAISYFVEAVGEEDPDRLDMLADVIEEHRRRKSGPRDR